MEPVVLIEWRESHGLSREDLARLLNTTYPTVFRWEKGERAIPPFLDLALKQLDRDLKTKKPK